MVRRLMNALSSLIIVINFLETCKFYFRSIVCTPDYEQYRIFNHQLFEKVITWFCKAAIITELIYTVSRVSLSTFYSVINSLQIYIVP